MAKYGSDDEDPKSFAALHKRLAAQRREEAAAGGAGAAVPEGIKCMAGRLAGEEATVPVRL